MSSGFLQEIRFTCLILLVFLAGALVWDLIREQRQQLRALTQEAERAEKVMRTCAAQRDAIRQLAMRMCVKKNAKIPTENLERLLWATDTENPRLSDLLASAQNRFILSRLRYQKRERKLRQEMEKPLAVLVSLCFSR